mgnify:CR=1 FL=1
MALEKIPKKKGLLILLLLSINFSAFANWELSEQADDFEEVIDYYIVSDKVDPNKPMSWPHDKAKAYLYFGCQSKSMSMSVTMNNLANDDSYAGDRRKIYIKHKRHKELGFLNHQKTLAILDKSNIAVVPSFRANVMCVFFFPTVALVCITNHINGVVLQYDSC